MENLDSSNSVMVFWTAMASVPGILALIIQSVEKLISKPKLILRVRKNEIKLLCNNLNDVDSGFFNGLIEIEVGNLGKELTTIVGVELVSDKGHRFMMRDSQKREFGTILLREGEAHIHTLRFWTDISTGWAESKELSVELRELRGKMHRLRFPLTRASSVNTIRQY